MKSDAKLISVNVGLPRVVVSNGDPVSTGIFELIEGSKRSVRVSDITQLYTREKHNDGLLRRAIEVDALSESWRSYFQHRLAKLRGASLD